MNTLTQKILIAITFSLCALFAWQSDQGNYAVDYYQYWIASENLADTNIYNYENQVRLANAYYSSTNKTKKIEFPSKYRKKRLKLSSTPFLYSTIFYSGNYDFDLNIHKIISIICSIASIFLLSHLYGLTPKKIIIISIYYFVFFAPLKNDLLVGNVNQIQLLLLSLFLWLEIKKSKTILAFAILALSIMYKPNTFLILLFALLYFIKNKEKLSKLIIGSILGIIFGLCFSVIKFKTYQPWLFWIKNLFILLKEPPYTLAEGNISILNLIKLNLSSHISILLIMVILAISTLSCLRSNKLDLAAGLGAITNILISTLVWPHYAVLTIPLLLALTNNKQKYNEYFIYFCLITFSIIPNHNQYLAISKNTGFILGMCGISVLYCLTIKNLIQKIEK